MTEAEFYDLFMEIIKPTGYKNTSYKFALALFLLEYSRNATGGPPYRAAYREIAEHFLKYYWSHACKSKLRQGPKNRIPKAIRIIGEEFQDQVYPKTFDELKKTERAKVDRCADKIRKECLHDVIPRFQWAGGRKQAAFFHYRAKEYHDSARNSRIRHDGGILINPDAVEFLKRNFAPLYNSVILEWVRFLESKNFGTPNLLRKIEARHKGPRGQRKFLKALRRTSDRCFYCHEKLRFDKSTHVDHVIPYDYIGDTEMWNAVLACQECNCAKLDRLPPKHYARKLSERNKNHYAGSKALRDSLAAFYHPEHGGHQEGAGGRMSWLIDSSIDWHYRNASKSGYPELRRFPCRARP